MESGGAADDDWSGGIIGEKGPELFFWTHLLNCKTTHSDALIVSSEDVTHFEVTVDELCLTNICFRCVTVVFSLGLDNLTLIANCLLSQY